MERRGVALPIVLVAVVLAIAIGTGAAVVWRTRYFDSALPAAIKDFLGIEEPPTESSTETPSEVLSQSEDPTKDWKTYTNEELGFSFKYPKDWKTAILANGEVFLFGPHAGESSEAQPRPQLEIFPIGGYGSDYGWDSPGTDYTGEESKWEVDERSVSVNGRSGKRAEHKYKPENLIQIVRIYFGSPSELRLEFYPLNGDLSTFDLILSSFEFTGT